MPEYYAAIEAGGTKFNCAVFENNTLLEETRIPTTTPKETIAAVTEFFSAFKQRGIKYQALGVASFGPLDLDKSSSSYGFITRTPKPDWSDTPLLPLLAKALNCPVAIDTDVNGAALAEAKWGAGRDKSVVVYVTVGTGVGGGVVINGQPLHGLVHPEIGHMLLPGHPELKGQCPFHENCAEGLASGKALGQIWQQPAETFADDHKAWELEALVLSQFCHNLMMSFSPHRLILGGGVMAKPGLLEAVIEKTTESLNDYLVMPHGKSLSDVIVTPGLGEKSGLMGALVLAKQHAQPLENAHAY